MTFTYTGVGEHVKAVLPIGTDSLTLQEITISSAVLARSSRTIDGAAHFSCEEYPMIASDKNTCGIAHEGDDTAFDREYYAFVPVDCKFTKITIHVAFGHRVASYSAGSPNLRSATVEVHRWSHDNAQSVYEKRVASGLTALSADGVQILVFDESDYMSAEFKTGDVISIHVTLDCVAGTDTSQEGILPVNPFQVANTSKMLSTPFVQFDGVRTK